MKDLFGDRLGPYLLGPNETPENGIYTGDARELALAIPDESVDLIFTDPVYQNIDDYRWLAETATRVLRDGKSVLAFCAHHRVIECGSVMHSADSLLSGPVLEHYISGPMGRLFSHSVQCNVIPCLWFSKNSPTNKWMALQQADYLTGDRGHKWGKNALMVQYRIEKFTDSNDIIVDFFCGGGTVPAVCKMLVRRWLAFEIEPQIAESARQRVRQTQPPLFVPEPAAVQAVMWTPSG